MLRKVSQAQLQRALQTKLLNVGVELLEVRVSLLDGQYAEMGRKAGLLGAMLGIVLFIALMSLVLVMLAIERNTRGARLRNS
jgi:hypothetical protein